MNKLWLFNFVTNWVIIVLCLLLVTQYPLTLPLVWLVLGTRQHALGALAHEALHGHVSTNRKVNDTLGAMCSWPLGLSVSAWRSWHIQHHAFQGTPKDPELPLKKANLERWQCPTRKQALLDALGFSTDEMLAISRAINSGVVPILVFNTIMLIFFHWAVLLFWYITLATSQVAVFRLRAKTEHDIFSVGTIKTSDPGILKRLTYLPCLTWLHYEHHSAPAVRYGDLKIKGLQ